MIKSELRTGTLSDSRHVVVHFSLAAPPLDQLDVGARGLKDAPNREELADVVRVDELLAAQHIDEVERLRKHHLRLRVDHADHGIVSGLL